MVGCEYVFACVGYIFLSFDFYVDVELVEYGMAEVGSGSGICLCQELVEVLLVHQSSQQ